GVAGHRPRAQARDGIRACRRHLGPPARLGMPPCVASGRGSHAGRPRPTRRRGTAARRRHTRDPRPSVRPVPPGAAPHARTDGVTTRADAAAPLPSCPHPLLPSPFVSSPLAPSPFGSSPPGSLSLRALTPRFPLPLGPHPLAPSPFLSSSPGFLSLRALTP